MYNFAELEHREYISQIIGDLIEDIPDESITVTSLYELTGLNKSDIREELYELFGEVEE